MTAEAKLADNWADHAVVAMPKVTDMARWIVANRNNLYRVDKANPSAFARVKEAIAKRWDEIDAELAA